MESKYSTYANPLIDRYCSKDMSYIFSPQFKFSTWRRLWVALAESEKELGLNITDEQINELKANIDNINFEEAKKIEKEVKQEKNVKKENNQSHAHNKNSYLTVNISKVDTLMNLVGEIVTTESMVDKQSQLENFDRDLFEKQARRLHQLTNELQDVVMSIRMVPISSTFTKMQRVVRDMSRKTGKSVELQLIGEQTEVDKNILENIWTMNEMD